MKSKLVSLVGVLLALGASSVGASTINVLWYTGGVESGSPGTYVAAINNLVAQEENPLFNTTGSVNTWNVTFWAGGPMPAGSFNTLVTASPQGGWVTYPDYTSLTSSVTAASFGNRVMLTGQDADWHYQFGPGSSSFDGPAGFLIDAINWSGSGTGMGGVFLGGPGFSYSMFAGSGTDVGGDNTVVIPGADATFPINTNLTSPGLSNWNTSAHTSYDGYDSTKWTGINIGPDLGLDAAGNPIAITIVTAATASGATTPDSGSTLTLLGGVILALAGLRRRIA